MWRLVNVICVHLAGDCHRFVHYQYPYIACLAEICCLRQLVVVICLFQRWIGAIIRLGSSHLFRFNDPGEAARLRQEMKNVSKQMLSHRVFLGSRRVGNICYYCSYCPLMSLLSLLFCL